MIMKRLSVIHGVELDMAEITNIIMYSDKTQYLPNIQPFTNDPLILTQIQDYHIYEIKEIENILNLDDNLKSLIENTKRKRAHNAKKILFLNNLINIIDKSHKEEDEKKIVSYFDKYKQAKLALLKLKPIKEIQPVLHLDSIE